MEDFQPLLSLKQAATKRNTFQLDKSYTKWKNEKRKFIDSSSIQEQMNIHSFFSKPNLFLHWDFGDFF